ncbi:MAG: 3-oxoacyl-ACP reductase FabG [Clostridia bacterium]|nr:3-oxoacyl-ACP reductase FabG [Clostridia bacterium]
MKTVLITGGSRGIGREMVRAFSNKGYRVAFTYKSSSLAAKELSDECNALAVKADSCMEAEVLAAVATVEREIGEVDILINNAAVSSFSLFTDLTLDDWRTSFGASVDGAFMYTKRTLPAMIRKGCGRIINISSVWGIVGSSCEVHYSCAKAALIGMTKALAKEVGPSGITVNCIAPGFIDTEMNAKLGEEDVAEIVDSTPLMRVGRVEDVAAAALFLASDEASFITGDVLNVSGGFVI